MAPSEMVKGNGNPIKYDNPNVFAAPNERLHQLFSPRAQADFADLHLPGLQLRVQQPRVVGADRVRAAATSFEARAQELDQLERQTGRRLQARVQHRDLPRTLRDVLDADCRLKEHDRRADGSRFCPRMCITPADQHAHPVLDNTRSATSFQHHCSSKTVSVLRNWRLRQLRVAPLGDTTDDGRPHLLRWALYILESDQDIISQSAAIRADSSSELRQAIAPTSSEEPTQASSTYRTLCFQTEIIGQRCSAIVPTNVDALKQASSKAQRVELGAHKKRIVDSLSPAERLEKVDSVLQLLHVTEFAILIEYTEVIIPIVYCLYLLMMRSLPNRIYYAQLRDLDDDKLEVNIENILLYAFLELLSFLALSRFLDKKLRVSSIHQLAFVLETQWQMV